MAKRGIRLITPPGDGFHGCGININDLVNETLATANILVGAAREARSDEFRSTRKIRKGGALDRLIDFGDQLIDDLLNR